MSAQLDMVARADELSRAQQWRDAAAGWQAVVQVNPVNGAYWHRLAQARFAVGDYAGALTAYREAMTLGVWPVHGVAPPPLESIFPGEISYRIACCHAQLGDTEQALHALAQAVHKGLREVDRVVTDEHLARLREDSRLYELLGNADPDQRSRAERWRADLQVLRREVKRRAPLPHAVGADFDTAVDALDQAIPELDDIHVVVGMWRLLRQLDDGHAYIDSAEAFPEWEQYLPLRFYLFAEGLFIPETDPRHESLLGAQVLAIDGRPVSQVLTALDPLLTRDNDYGPAATAPVWMRQPTFLHALDVANDPGAVTLTLRLMNGTVTEVTVAAEESQTPRAWPRQRPPQYVRLADTLTDPVPAYLRDVDNLYWFEYLPATNLVYFQFNGIGDDPSEPLTAFYERMFATIDDRQAAALVIDLRWNGGGNTFLGLPLVHHIIQRERINHHGQLFVIIGRNTFSAAQNTATFLDRHTNAVFVGEPTGSRPNFIGETAPFRLPRSGLHVNVSDVHWQTSWPFDHRTAIAPDIYTPLTFTAYRANRDPATDAILTHLDNSGRLGRPGPPTP